MPTLLDSPALPTDLEARVEAFERVWDSGNCPALTDFLPPADDTGYGPVLGELIRIEMEFLWERRTPRPLEFYLARFPVLQSDPELLASIAFEEYRQRLQAGERVSPDEYRRRFGLNPASWQNVIAPSDPPDLEPECTNAVSIRQQVDIKAPLPQKPVVPHASESATQLPEIDDIVLRRFRIKERLGKGAFGSVYLAERLDLFNRPVALKFLPDPSVEPAMLAQMIHENIVPIESVDRYGSLLVICMPFRGRATLQHVVDSLPRESLGAHSTGRLFLSTLQERSGSRSSGARSSSVGKGSSSRNRGLNEAGIDPQFYSLSQLTKLAGMSHVEASLRITLGIVSGLVHAHEHNIIHRDLKPANVLLSDDGTPMILDFNLATQIRREMPLDCMRLGGTFPYMAPEQIQAAREKHECRDPRGDLYSTGVVLYELLTGRHPFPKTKRAGEDFFGRMLEERKQTPPDPCQINPAVPRSVADIIAKLLSFDASQRYQSARELKEDIERELTNRPLAHARESSLWSRLTKFRRRRQRLTTAMLVGAAATLFLLLPAGIIAESKARSARRLQQTQRAEALVLRDNSQRVGLDAQALVHSRYKDSRLFHMGLEKAEELAKRYAIQPGTAWEERPEVSRLDEKERRELETTLGETFHVVSIAATQWANDTNDSGLRSRSKELLGLAANCFEKAGRLPNSQPTADVAESSFPSLNDEDLYTAATELMEKSQYRRAAKALEELTQRNPHHFTAWYSKATCYDNLGDAAKAERAWETCVVLEPESAIGHYNHGLALKDLARFEAAEHSFDEAFRLDPQMTGALLARGTCRMWQGGKRLELAEQDFTRCLEFQSLAIAAYYYRSRVREQLGKKDAAAQDLAQALKIEPDDEFTYSIRGRLKLGIDPIAAIADLDKALEINPRNQASLRNRYYVAAEKLERLPEAISFCDKFLEYYPDVLRAHADRGVYLARLGKVEEAVKEADYCLSATTSTAFMKYQIGTLYAQLSTRDAAYRQKAVDLLGQAVASGFDQLNLFKVDTDLKPLVDDREFEKIKETVDRLQKLGRK